MIAKTLTIILVLAVVTGQALKVAVTEIYATSSCSSSKVAALPTNIDSACNQVGLFSGKVDCATRTVSLFPTPNCTGTPSVRGFDCVAGESSPIAATSLFCQDIAASSLLGIEIGTSCDTNDEIVDVQFTAIVPLGCTASSANESSNVEKLGNGTVILTKYQSTTCTGNVSSVLLAGLGKCVNGIKCSLLSTSTSISLSAVTLAMFGMAVAMTTTA